MATPDINEIKQVIHKWASKHLLIKKIYIFGSRARDDFNENSDLDVAIEFFKRLGDANLWVTGFCETSKLKIELQKLIPNYNVQLEQLHPTETPHVKKGVDRSSILIYEREQNK